MASMLEDAVATMEPFRSIIEVADAEKTGTYKWGSHE